MPDQVYNSSHTGKQIDDGITAASTALQRDGSVAATARIPFAQGIETDSVAAEESLALSAGGGSLTLGAGGPSSPQANSPATPTSLVGKEWVDGLLAFVSYTGTGAATRTVELPMAARAALIFAQNVPAVTTDPSSPAIVKGYFALAVAGGSGSAGASLADAQLTVYNDADSVMAEARRKLNAPGVTYQVILFR